MPKYCSPLKRQAVVDFPFTNATGEAMSQQNKQLVDSIIATIGLQQVFIKPKKKPSKNTRDAAVQTSKPFCQACEIRQSVQFCDASTLIDSEHFSHSVQTQVIEKDLINSKAVFTHVGGIADGAPISISHMTPAQLVSQLAARAKTLKQPTPQSTDQEYRERTMRNQNMGASNSYQGYDYGRNQYQNYRY